MYVARVARSVLVLLFTTHDILYAMPSDTRDARAVRTMMPASTMTLVMDKIPRTASV